MRRSAALAVALLSLCAFGVFAAPPLPPELLRLQAALDGARQAQRQAQQRVDAETRANLAAARRLHYTTVALLRAGRTPSALGTVHALAHGQVAVPGLLAAARHQQAGQNARLAHRLARLIALQRQNTAELSRLSEVQGTYAEAGQNLTRLERSALTDAALEADTLAAALAAPPAETPTSPTAVPPPVPSSSGSRKLPVLGRVVSGFRSGSTTERPDGLTFRAAPGAAVTSVNTGQVIYSGPFRNFGGLVIVQSSTALGPTTHLVYANLADLTVDVGTGVTPGTVLGHLAPTPPSTLYFEVRRRGKPVDPETFL